MGSYLLSLVIREQLGINTSHEGDARCRGGMNERRKSEASEHHFSVMEVGYEEKGISQRRLYK
jgi:hypothetical protein